MLTKRGLWPSSVGCGTLRIVFIERFYQGGDWAIHMSITDSIKFSSDVPVSIILRRRRNILVIFLPLYPIFSILILLYFDIGEILSFLIMIVGIWIWGMTILILSVKGGGCPYCHAAVNGFFTASGQRWWSPAIMDQCPNCHRELTLPYDPELKPRQQS